MKYLVISDCHIGQDTRDGNHDYSLLSQVPGSAGEKYTKALEKQEKLITCMKDFAGTDPINIIGTGDIFELSSAYLSDAFFQFISFFNRIPVDIESFTLVAGNHDHHLWIQHAEERHHLFNPSNSFESTAIEGEPSGTLLYSMELAGLDSSKMGTDFRIAYPTLELVLGDEQYVFTHGHFIGGVYTLFSQILQNYLPNPWSRDALATVNAPLLEFIYFLLGQTGMGCGANGVVEKIYDEAAHNKCTTAKTLVSPFVDTLLPSGILSGIPDKLERRVIKWVLARIIETVIKNLKITTAADRNKPAAVTQQQAADWANHWLKYITQHDLSKPTILVHGHTHRAYEVQIPDSNMTVYNMGAWLVEDPEALDPETYVLLIDTEKKQRVFQKV